MVQGMQSIITSRHDIMQHLFELNSGMLETLVCKNRTVNIILNVCMPRAILK